MWYNYTLEDQEPYQKELEELEKKAKADAEEIVDSLESDLIKEPNETIYSRSIDEVKGVIKLKF